MILVKYQEQMKVTSKRRIFDGCFCRLGYAYQFEDNFTIGANVNYITSKIQFQFYGYFASAGVTYHNERTKELCVGFQKFWVSLKRIMVLEKIYLSEQT